MGKKDYKIKPSSEIEEMKILEYDENGVIKIDEIPDTNFDMKYYEYDTKDIGRVEKIIRSSEEYRSFIQFMKQNLDVNHCSFYEGYSMKNGLTIELHHSPFTLYNITEAVIVKFMNRDKYWETFRVAEEVIRLHYEFKVGLTPLNPTAHKLVHNGVLKVHPKIVIGDWKSFYGEYNAYLSEDAILNYKEAIDLETKGGVDIPKIMEYNPTSLETPNNKMITSDFIDRLCIESKIKQLEKM